MVVAMGAGGRRAPEEDKVWWRHRWARMYAGDDTITTLRPRDDQGQAGGIAAAAVRGRYQLVAGGVSEILRNSGLSLWSRGEPSGVGRTSSAGDPVLKLGVVSRGNRQPE